MSPLARPRRPPARRAARWAQLSAAGCGDAAWTSQLRGGASVDRATCEPGGAEFDSLCETWTGPAFDAAQPASWHARILEDSTCRWSQFLCNEQTVDCGALCPGDPLYSCCDPNVEHVIQERAWTSPIWYVPPE